MIRTLAFALTLLAAAPALAGLQRWEVTWLDKAGDPVGYGHGGSPEAFAHDARGYIVSIGCAPGGGHVLALTAPQGVAPNFAGPSIHPGLRIARPGTDLFSGAVGPMSFDGRRYVGPVEEAVLAPLREKIHDGSLMLTELATHTTVKLELEQIKRALGEVVCR